MKLNQLFLFIFLIASPFTSAFAISGTINLPIICGTLLFLTNVLEIIKNTKSVRVFFQIESMLVIAFLLLVLNSFILNGIKYQFSLNHTIAYISSFLLFFLSPFYTIFSSQNKQDIFRLSLKGVFIAVLISSSFSLVEFIGTNFLNIPITDFIPRFAVQEYDPLIVGFLIRSRGFAEESGHYAFMIEIFAPLAFYYMYELDNKLSKNIKLIISIVIILSLLTAFSVSSFILVPASIFIYFIVSAKSAMKFIFSKIGKILLLVFVGFIFWQILNNFLPISEILKITIEEKFDSFSSYDRAIRSDFFASQLPNVSLINLLFGSGPCWFKLKGFDDSYSFLSLYQTITFEIGILGLCIYLLFIGGLMIKTILLKSKFRKYAFVALLCGIVHYNTISNYWYPWFWILCVLVSFSNKIETDKFHFLK